MLLLHHYGTDDNLLCRSFNDLIEILQFSFQVRSVAHLHVVGIYKVLRSIVNDAVIHVRVSNTEGEPIKIRK